MSRAVFRAFFFALLSLVVTGSSVAESRTLTAEEKLIYRPVNRPYWLRVDALIQGSKIDNVFKFQTPSGTQAEKDEWKLGTAKALIAGGNFVHAQYLLTGVAAKSIGTRQGLEALRMIHEIARDGIVDETYLEELAFDLDTKVDDPEARSMVGYFRARSLLRKGYQEWSQAALADIEPGSTWADELEFDRTLQLLNSGDSANAYEHFETLMESPKARKQTIKLAKLALARLVFERKDFKASIATYLNIDLPTRERARSLNELAWAYYYDRAYGKALGTIRALKSAYFQPLLSPESMLLEMLIYRELCHYQRVKDLSVEFNRTYRQVFTNIEERRPVEGIAQLVQMALQEGVLQRRALAIQQVRSERRVLDRQQTASIWANNDALIDLLKFGEKRERIADAEITRFLKARADGLANWFLDLREQVWFLEYEASMRMIQMSDDQAEIYSPPQASKIKPETLFWPVVQEAWLDELLDYEILVKDQCTAPQSPAGRRPASARGRR